MGRGNECFASLTELKGNARNVSTRIALRRPNDFINTVDKTKYSLIIQSLRTMSPFVTAHTFYESRNDPRNLGFLRTVPTKTKIILCGL